MLPTFTSIEALVGSIPVQAMIGAWFVIGFLQAAIVVVCPLTKHSAVYIPAGLDGIVIDPVAVVDVWTIPPSGFLMITEYVFGVQYWGSRTQRISLLA